MKMLSQLKSTQIQYVFADIDGTLTENGRLPKSSYTALWDLYSRGIHVIPVTGRPAGWCEMIARFWPVLAVIGENGAFYFRYHDGQMKRRFAVAKNKVPQLQKKLQRIGQQVLKAVPDSAVSSDQFSRMFDLAIDFAEDVGPLSKTKVEKIVQVFKRNGATAKVSSIHVNGWFGNYDKLTMCHRFCRDELKLNFAKSQSKMAFIGDSPNDEPMFKAFKNSVAVANIKEFWRELEHQPQYVTRQKEAKGFSEFARHLLK